MSVIARVLALLATTVALPACAGQIGLRSRGAESAHPAVRAGAVTFLGNSFSSGLAGSVPHSVMELAVSSDGVAVSGSSWEEYNHDARLFDTRLGRVLGPFTPTRDSGGIYGVAIDRKYVYAVSALSVYRFSRSQWMNRANVGWFDDGHNTGVAPLAVDSKGKGWLMGLAECGHRLFVADPGEGRPLGDNGEVSPTSAQIKVIPLDLSGVTRTWSVPRARTIACDRQGEIWVLQQGVAGGPRPRVSRYTPDGKRLTSFSLPGYPTGLAADPTNDSIVVPDNGSDQDFKRFDYKGRLIETIGVRRGYLARPTPGLIGPRRFVGPRAIAIDGSGNVYTAESGLPGVGQLMWSDMGPAAIITKFKANGKVVWRDYGLEFGGTGEPTADGSRFFDKHFEYIRDRAGKYRPYAFTADPFANPRDTRVGADEDWYGSPIYERDMNGHRYIIDLDDPAVIYVKQPHSEIFKPAVSFNNNQSITTNGNTVRAPDGMDLRNTAKDFWLDTKGNMWAVGGWSRIWEYARQGFTPEGTPLYDWGHVRIYPWPPQLAQAPRRIEIYGNTVYISGFSASDSSPDNDWDSFKSLGRHLLKFSALPTRAGWSRPVWEHDFSYGTGTKMMPYPTSFAADPAGRYVAVGWLFDADTNQGRIDVLAGSDGSSEKMMRPPVPSLGHVGDLDMQRSLTARNGWVWAEDDLQSKIYGICLSQHCS